MTPVGVAATGFATGLGLIVAIGAQNAYVIRQGLRREHVGVVVVICLVADVVLIGVGTLGIGGLVAAAPWLLQALRWGGVAYLTWFAVLAFRSALAAGPLPEGEATPRGSVAATTAALTFLNPHVYLDTVVMVGSLANQFGPARWVFAGGAMGASILWFPVLGFGAHRLARPLSRPGTWRAVDVGVGIVMLAVAARLALSSP